MPVISIIQVLIISQSLLFGIALLMLKSDRRFSNRLLAYFLVLLALQMILHLLEDRGLLPKSLWSLRGIVFAYGPLLYLYVYSIARRAKHFKKWDFLHFLPALIIIICSYLFAGFEKSMGWLLYLSMGIYVTHSYLELYWFKKQIAPLYPQEKINLNWLKLAIGIFSIIIFFDLISFSINFWFPGSMADNWSDYVVLGFVLLFVNIMVFKSLLQPRVLADISEDKLRTIESDKITRTQIFQAHHDTIQTLEALMTQQQPYLQPNLSIQDLALSMEISPRLLSEIINHYYHQNFAEFINSYRLAAAEKRFQQPKDEKETVLEVMYEVGFNSKSSFNTLFKKRTGLTPTEYKQKYATK
ncbi:MAG: helix-turn-helix domain-containing protein [Saprospiraceae bacterium]